MPAGYKLFLASFVIAALVLAHLAMRELWSPKPQVVRSRYSNLRNYELKKEGIRVAERLRRQAARARLREIDALLAPQRGASVSALALGSDGRSLVVEAIQVRDEMLSRLPRAKRPKLPYTVLELARSAEMIDEAADVVETLARLLPEMWFRDEEWRAPAAPMRPTATLVS
jgi:hypothetical protein